MVFIIMNKTEYILKRDIYNKYTNVDIKIIFQFFDSNLGFS